MHFLRKISDFFGFAQSPDHQVSTSSPADQLFLEQLHNLRLPYEITAEGLYKMSLGETEVVVNLENIRREYARNQDSTAITNLVKQLEPGNYNFTPEWESVKSLIRFSLEPNDYESGLNDTLHDFIVENLVKLYVFTINDGSGIAWITHSMLEHWGVARETVEEHANENMKQLVAGAKLDISEIDGVKLGIISTTDPAFKASAILTAQFRDLVSPTHGWPVYVVAPARDFVYVISLKDKSFLSRVGHVVLEEFNTSAYSVTSDVLEVSDAGIKVIGSFARESG